MNNTMMELVNSFSANVTVVSCESQPVPTQPAVCDAFALVASSIPDDRELTWNVSNDANGGGRVAVTWGADMPLIAEHLAVEIQREFGDPRSVLRGGSVPYKPNQGNEGG